MSTNETNGKDPNKNEHDSKVVQFPTLAERDRQRKAEQKQSKKAQKQEYPPLFNFGKIPSFVRFLSIACILTFIVLNILMDKETLWQVYSLFGFTPAYFTGAEDMPNLWPLLSPFTHMFIHGSAMHLIFNLVMGVALGIYCERFLGARGLAIFFFAAGFAGAMAFLMTAPTATFPLIGASGGISGFFGAAITLMHGQGLLGQMSRKPLWPTILFWTVFMFITGVIGGGNIAWQAHIGGFLAGVGMIHLVKTGRLKL